MLGFMKSVDYFESNPTPKWACSLVESVRYLHNKVYKVSSAITKIQMEWWHLAGGPGKAQ